MFNYSNLVFAVKNSTNYANKLKSENKNITYITNFLTNYICIYLSIVISSTGVIILDNQYLAWVLVVGSNQNI